MSLPNPPGQIILNLKDTYGAMFVGCQLSMALLAIQYYQTYVHTLAPNVYVFTIISACTTLKSELPPSQVDPSAMN
jgi:hypothetical protein